MAGYFAFVPLHAKQIGMSGSAVPLTVYAALVVVLRLAFAKLPTRSARHGCRAQRWSSQPSA